MEWYLLFLRGALKQAVLLQATLSRRPEEEHKIPPGVFTLCHPFTRDIILALNSHLVSFHRFVSSIRRPLVTAPGVNIATQGLAFQLMGLNGLAPPESTLRDVAVSTLLKQVIASRLDECGIAFDRLNSALARGPGILNGHSNGASGSSEISVEDHGACDIKGRASSADDSPT